MPMNGNAGLPVPPGSHEPLDPPALSLKAADCRTAAPSAASWRVTPGMCWHQPATAGQRNADSQGSYGKKLP